MMISTLTDFDEASTFERAALAAGFPLIARNESYDSIDLRTAPTTVTMVAFMSSGEHQRAALINDFRPLLVGAAWKVIDLLLEFAFQQNGLQPKKKNKWTITEKQQHATASHGICPPLTSDADVWSRLTALYANTVEARHCLVHRRFSLAPSGDMCDIKDEHGHSQPDITAVEQEAFCRVAQIVASMAISTKLSQRNRLDLIWWFDQLAAHHRQAPLSGVHKRPVEVVRINAVRTSIGWTVDLATAHAKASQAFPGRPYFDVEIYFPSSGLPSVIGRLEEAPRVSDLVLDLANLPPWTQR